jgi:hypothetical protein
MYLLVASGMQMHPVGNRICSPFGYGYDVVSVNGFPINPNFSKVLAETAQLQPPLGSRLIGQNNRLFFLLFPWKAYVA